MKRMLLLLRAMTFLAAFGDTWGGGHGLRIASMEAAVQRRNGYLKVSAKDGVFVLDAVLCDVFPDK